MSYLVDTNIISEVRKGSRCHPKVARWYETVDDDDLYLSVLVLGEIRRGIERAKAKNPQKASGLERWLEGLLLAFEGYILPIDQATVEAWGRMTAPRSMPVIDTLQAATAQVRGLTFVTHNLADVRDTRVRVLDPFTFDS